MVIHTALPELLTAAAAEVLDAADVRHVDHGDRDVMAAAEAAAGEADALIGPFLSRDVARAVEATAPAGVPLIAPMATWAGVTRDDEPGCEDDPAGHRGTVLRMVARDTVVAARIAAHVRTEVAMALPFAPLGDEPFDHMVYGAEQARRAAQLLVEAGGDLSALRAAGRFDEHGDPVDPPVWLWRAGRDWTLRPDRPL
jgi:hypothetical protein